VTHTSAPSRILAICTRVPVPEEDVANASDGTDSACQILSGRFTGLSAFSVRSVLDEYGQGQGLDKKAKKLTWKDHC
jgi:hypothetical protein